MLFHQICVKTLKNSVFVLILEKNKIKHHLFFWQKLDPGILTKGTWSLKKFETACPGLVNQLSAFYHWPTAPKKFFLSSLWKSFRYSRIDFCTISLHSMVFCHTFSQFFCKSFRKKERILNSFCFRSNIHSLQSWNAWPSTHKQLPLFTSISPSKLNILH